MGWRVFGFKETKKKKKKKRQRKKIGLGFFYFIFLIVYWLKWGFIVFERLVKFHYFYAWFDLGID